MKQSQIQASASVEQAASAGEVLNKINEKINTISHMNSQIASVSEEHMSINKEINRNINNISEVSSHTAQGAHKMSKASSELMALADQLRITVGQFKIK